MPTLMPLEAIVEGMNEATMLKRAATLADVGNTADLSAGMIVD